MPVRAKLTVESITAYRYGDAKLVKLSPQYDLSIPEDQRFAKATPSGSVELYIDNPAALEQLAPDGKPGRSFYVDFTPVEEPKQEALAV